jgi:hypothetical protein
MSKKQLMFSLYQGEMRAGYQDPEKYDADAIGKLFQKRARGLLQVARVKDNIRSMNELPDSENPLWQNRVYQKVKDLEVRNRRKRRMYGGYSPSLKIKLEDMTRRLQNRTMSKDEYIRIRKSSMERLEGEWTSDVPNRIKDKVDSHQERKEAKSQGVPWYVTVGKSLGKIIDYFEEYLGVRR